MINNYAEWSVIAGEVPTSTKWNIIGDNAEDANDRLVKLEPSALQFVLDGGGVTLSTGLKFSDEIPYDCDIVGVKALADQTGSIVIDVWVDSYANYPPTDADSITASAPITISGSNKSNDTALTGWTTSLNKGDVYAVNIDSVTSIQSVTVSLAVIRR